MMHALRDSSCRHMHRSWQIATMFVVVGSMLAGGCRKIGESVVDDFPLLGPGSETGCPRPRVCDAKKAPRVNIAVRGFEGVSVVECQGGSATSIICSEGGAAVSDGGVNDGGMPLAVDCQKRQNLECSNVVIEVADDVDLVQLSGVSLLHTSLVLHASHPSVVELVGAIAHDVVATLDGPVTLRVTDSVSSVDFRVVADGSATGASFEARHSDFTNLWTGTPKAPFPGTVRIDETRLAQSQIEAEQVRLESSTLVVSRLGAARLDGIDVNIRNSEFSLGGGLLSAVTLDTCEVTGCGELTLVAGQVFDTRIAPCSDGPLRAYSTTFETAEVAGNIESDDSGWHRTVFGAQLAGPMVFWGGGGKNSTFCEDVSSVVFDDNAEWACTACPDGFAREDAVCVLPDTLPYSATEDNPCVSFVTPPECSPPFPENVRRAGPFFK